MLDLSSKIFNWIQIIFHQNQKTKMAIILNRLRKILTGHYWLKMGKRNQLNILNIPNCEFSSNEKSAVMQTFQIVK